VTIATGWKREDDLTWRALRPFGTEIGHDFSMRLSPAASRRFVALFRESGLRAFYEPPHAPERE
jgi:hypothetical protein